MPKPFSAIPGPKGWPLIGSLLDYSRFGRYSFDRMHVAKRENLALYGKIYKEKLSMNIVNLLDPADIETVYRAEGKYPERPANPLFAVATKREKRSFGFSTLNGEPWWRQRQAIQQPMMSPGAAHVYLPIQNQVADDFVRFLSRKLDEGSGKLEEDITRLLTKYTMEADNMFGAMQKTILGFPWFAFYQTQVYREYIDACRTCQRIARTYVEEALRSHEVEVDEKKVKTITFLRTLVEKNSERLTNEEMVQLAIDLITGGIHTTAFALSFCLYNLAKNVDKQNRLLSEIDSVLDRTSCSPVTPEVLNQMQYLKACVKESFRLNFPVISGPIRQLSTDLVLSDYLVPKGTIVWFNFQTMCLLEEYFEHADHYIPERWLKGEGDTLRPTSNFFMQPFGYGSRMCIGRRFAEQEIWLALIKILQRFRVQLDLDASEHRAIGMINRLFTMPDARIPLQFVPR